MQNLPGYVTLGANSNAIEGGIKLWQDISDPVTATNVAPANAPKTAKSAIKVG